jgi:hypothetical protein
MTWQELSAKACMQKGSPPAPPSLLPLPPPTTPTMTTPPASCSPPCWRNGAPLLVKHVLERLDPTDCAILARVGKPWLAVVVANNLPRAGKGGAMKLKLVDFLGSVARLAWAKDNGCRWDTWTCFHAARDGHLEALQWARAQDPPCQWDDATCDGAARNGHLEVLKWARAQGCQWDEQSCILGRCGRAHGGVAVVAGARPSVGCINV